MDFKDFYKFPLRKTDLVGNVLTEDNHVAIDFPMGWFNRSFHKLSDSEKNDLVNKLNDGELALIDNPDYEYLKGVIFRNYEDDEPKVVCFIQNYHHLKFTMNLSAEEIEAVQEQFAKYIIRRLP